MVTRAPNHLEASVVLLSSTPQALALLLHVFFLIAFPYFLSSSWWWGHSERPSVHFSGAGDDRVSAHLAGPWIFSNLHEQEWQLCQFANLSTWIGVAGPSELRQWCARQTRNWQPFEQNRRKNERIESRQYWAGEAVSPPTHECLLIFVKLVKQPERQCWS